jgi:hypothetical protein
MTTHFNVRHYPVAGLLDAIEKDSEALARLFETCGSRRNFGPVERHRFERLLRHRSRLIAKLEGLRSPRRPDKMDSGE